MPDASRTLFVSDLDGTLLNKDASLQPLSIKLINDCISDGMRFSYATARSWHSAQRIVKHLKLSDPVVTHNGAFIVDPVDGQVIDASVLHCETSLEIIRAAVDASAFPLVHSIIDDKQRVSWLKGRETEGISKYLSFRKGDSRLRGCDDISSLCEGMIFYVTVIGRRDEIEAIIPLIQRPGVSLNFQQDTYSTDEFWLEAAHKDATKANGVRKLLRLTGCDYVICFGDNLNDIPMFALADEAYAVANAAPSLCRHATALIGSNEEDSVAKMIDSRFRSLFRT